MNSELPGKNAVRRHIVQWGVFYLVLIAGLAGLGYWASHQLGDEELPPGHVSVSVSKQRYKPGEIVSFTIKNNFPVTIYVNNFCPSEPLNVYRWGGESWQRIHDQADTTKCAGQSRQIGIPAQQGMTYSYKNWPNLFNQPGRYRIVAAIEHYEALPFQDFEILQPPKLETKNVPAAPTVQPSPAPTTTPKTNNIQGEPESEQETEIDD